MFIWRSFSSFSQPCSTSHVTHMRGTMATPMPICTKRLMLSMVGISMGMFNGVRCRANSSITFRRKGDSTMCAMNDSLASSSISTSRFLARTCLGGTTSVNSSFKISYNPANHPDFDAEREIASLRELVKRVEERAESAELAKALHRQALGRSGDPSKVAAAELDGVLIRNRARWVRNHLVRAAMKRATHLGWPNTYTFTKSLGESLLAQRGRDLAIAIVRPSIVESSTR